MSAFRWYGRREEAAMLVAEDKLSDEQIARSLGIAERTLERWKLHPDFAARVTSLVAELRQAIVARGIADRQNRVDALNERWQTLRGAVKAWGEEYRAAPGGAKTGYYARKVAAVKVLGQFEQDEKGRSHFVPIGEQIEVEEWALDTGLLKELREHEKQAAIELEQWKEKQEQTHKFDLSGLSDEELDQLERLVGKLAKPG